MSRSSQCVPYHVGGCGYCYGGVHLGHLTVYVCRYKRQINDHVKEHVDVAEVCPPPLENIDDTMIS